MFFMPLTTIALSNVPMHKMASATGLFTFVRTLAGGIGASLVMTVWDRRSVLHHAYLTETVSNGSNAQALIAQLEATGMTHQQALTYLNQNITQQALIIGSNDVFYAFGFIFLLLIGLIWLAKPPFHH